MLLAFAHMVTSVWEVLSHRCLLKLYSLGNPSTGKSPCTALGNSTFLSPLHLEGEAFSESPVPSKGSAEHTDAQ